MYDIFYNCYNNFKCLLKHYGSLELYDVKEINYIDIVVLTETKTKGQVKERLITCLRTRIKKLKRKDKKYQY